MTQRVLIVEDQPPVAQAIGLLLELQGITSRAVKGAAEAVEALSREAFDLVIQDMNFSPGETSGEEGVALFRRIREEHPELPILLITAFTSLETAVQLIKEGASDYLAKPWDDAKLTASVRNLLKLRRLESENLALRADRRRARDELARRYDLRGLVYLSEAMHSVVSLAVRVARTDVPILITGPNGTGKERLADVVVANSGRSQRPFVKVNLGALPDSLLEAELFGAEPGAFTGADKRRIGRFEAAEAGTLLLDEIATLSPEGQTRLLRVLQDGEYQRLGSSQTLAADVRIVAVTNADLPKAIEAGTFRQDLYFRLNVIELEVPPLGERLDDLEPLAEHFLAAGIEERGEPLSLSPQAAAALRAHDWPGNVRELENVMRRACLIASGPSIEPAHLRLGRAGSDTDGDAAGGAAPDSERTRIEQALTLHRGVLAHAAEELGLSRQALYRRMRRFGIRLEKRLRD